MVIILVPLMFWMCLLNAFLMLSNYPAAARNPVILDHPFTTVWNAPSRECQEKYNVSLDLGIFDVAHNQNQSFTGKDITLFYSNRLGYYPYYTTNGTAVNGGLPQNASLKNHLWKTQQDVKNTILGDDFKGLAVVDWESWRPLWIRNWGPMEIYRNKSIDLVKTQHPHWPTDKVAEEAQLEFEQSSRAFMEQTLALGEALRPEGFWGFYGFPDCYNNDFKNPNYAGKCPGIEKSRNDQLQWLWKQSSALYPSIYLPGELQFSNKILSFVRHRIHEAFRVLKMVGDSSVPVLPYTSISFEFTQDFLSQENLVYTIGESASQGAAGVILWGSKNYSYSQEACLDMKKYMDTVLGAYIVNVTSSTRICSEILCSKNGRCVRKKEYPDAFLHLSPSSFSIKKHPVASYFTVTGQISREERAEMAEKFTCRCYNGREDSQCKKKVL